MYPPLNPPPLKDSDLPLYGAPPPSLSEIKIPLLLFLVYGLCGAIVGIGIAGLAVSMEYAFRWEEWKHEDRVVAAFAPRRAVNALRMPEPELYLKDVVGWAVRLLLGGGIAGFFLAVVIAVWRPARLPIRTASLCASVGGTCVLLIMGGQLIEQREDSREFIRTAIAIAASTFLCGLFGFVHALIVRRAISCLESWQTRSGPVAY